MRPAASASELAYHGAAIATNSLGDHEEILARCHDMSNDRAIAAPAPSRSFASPASPIR